MLTLSWQLTLGCARARPVLPHPGPDLGATPRRLAPQQMNLNADMGTRMTERFNVAGALLVKLFGRPRARTASTPSGPAGCATSGCRSP